MTVRDLTATLQANGAISVSPDSEASFGVPNVSDGYQHIDQTEADVVMFRNNWMGALGGIGVLRGVGGECAAVWETPRNFRILEGAVNTDQQIVNVTETVVTLDAMYGSGNRRFDALVVDFEGTPTFRKGEDLTPTDPDPALPKLQYGDVLIAYVHVDNNTLSQDRCVDVRLFSRGLPRATTAARDDWDKAAPGYMFYNTTTGGLQVNLGSRITPNWFSFAGPTISGGSVSGNLSIYSNDLQTGTIRAFVNASGGAAFPTTGSFEWRTHSADTAVLHNSQIGNIGASSSQTHMAISPPVPGDRAAFTMTDSPLRRLFASTWYGGGLSHAAAGLDGLEELHSLSVHGMTHAAHYVGGDSAIGQQHTSFYYCGDNYVATTSVVETAIPLGSGRGARSTIRLTGDLTASVGFGDVLLIYRNDRVPNRDWAASGSGSNLGGWEYVFVIPDSANTGTGGWGAAGQKVYTAGTPGYTTLDVLRGWWGTPAYAHPVGNRVWIVARNSDRHFLNVTHGGSTAANYYPREATSSGGVSTINVEADFNIAGAVGFNPDGFWQVDPATVDAARNKGGGFEAGTGSTQNAWNLVQTWGTGVTHGPGGWPRMGTALRITGHAGATVVWRSTNASVFSSTTIGDTAALAKDSGTNATGAFTATTFRDTAKTWATNQWAGYYLVLTADTGSPQTRKILSNNVDTLTIEAPFEVFPDTSTDYEIRTPAAGWPTNQWVGYDVVIVGGTGSGQSRTVTSNTSTTITVPTWTTTPDATSDFEIRLGDHPTAHEGAIFYRTDLDRLRLQIGTGWYSVLTIDGTLDSTPTWPNVGGVNVGITLLNTGQTWTANANFVRMTSTHTNNLTALTHYVINLAGQINSNFVMADYSTFRAGMTINRANSGTENFATGTFAGYDDRTTLTIDTLTSKTLSQYTSFLSFPTLTRTNSGTFTLTTLNQVSTGGVIQAGVTVDLRRGLNVSNFLVMAGTINTNIGIDVAQLTQGTTNIGIRNASTEVYTPSTQQSGALSAAIAANATVLSVRTTSAGAYTGTLPTMQNGQLVIWRNTDTNRHTLQNGVSTTFRLRDTERTLFTGDIMVGLNLSADDDALAGFYELAYSSALTSTRKSNSTIPKPVQPSSAIPTTQALSDTLSRIGRVELDSPMVLTEIAINLTAAASSPTIKLAVYNEHGVQMYVGSLTGATGLNYFSVSNVAFPAGDYYVSCAKDVAGTATLSTYDTDEIFRAAGSSSPDVLCGTLAVATGTQPGSITPSSSITGADNSTPYVRFNGVYV